MADPVPSWTCNSMGGALTNMLGSFCQIKNADWSVKANSVGSDVQYFFDLPQAVGGIEWAMFLVGLIRDGDPYEPIVATRTVSKISHGRLDLSFTFPKLPKHVLSDSLQVVPLAVLVRRSDARSLKLLK